MGPAAGSGSDRPARRFLPGAMPCLVHRQDSAGLELNADRRAAAWVTPEGQVTTVMEDGGHHNALDKLLGQRALARLANREGFIIMSSRASYELVRKCARLGVPVLATISAPTTLAVDIARQAGMQLYGFCRGEQAVRHVP